MVYFTFLSTTDTYVRTHIMRIDPSFMLMRSVIIYERSCDLSIDGLTQLVSYRRAHSYVAMDG